METKYFITPMPHKPLSDKIVEAMKMRPVRLEALYEGGDPWNDASLDDALPDFLSMDAPIDTSLIVANIQDLVEEVKDGTTVLGNFCQTYTLTDWRKANEKQLLQLEERLKIKIQQQGVNRGTA
jgi:hypothetical protein